MKTILFDLDGTLLKMDFDTFVKAYFSSLVKKYSSQIDPELLVKALTQSIYATIQNDGSATNEEVFLRNFNAITNANYCSEDFEEYYLNEFQKIKNVLQIDGEAREIIDILKDKGYRLILATNPIFPRIATVQRMNFVGLNLEDFDFITHYGNCHYTKPNLDFYRELLKEINETPKNCIMVGNDLDEDMVVNELGMDFVLINNCLINKSNKTVEAVFNGTMQEFIAYAKEKL